MRLSGKTVLITGAGSGIGRALAIHAAAQGSNVLLVGRQLSKLEETKSLFRPGSFAGCYEADVTTNEGRLAIKTAVVQGERGLDVLINNAGCILNQSLLESLDCDVERMIKTNLLAPIFLTRDLLPILRKSGKSRVVNVGSLYGDIAMPGFSVYSATKFGVRGLSDALRRELSEEGVGVTYVAPRATLTEGVASILPTLKKQGIVPDDPMSVADWIWSAIERGQPNAYPPAKERLFVAIQRIFPSIIDQVLTKQYARDRMPGPVKNGRKLNRTTSAN